MEENFTKPIRLIYSIDYNCYTLFTSGKTYFDELKYSVKYFDTIEEVRDFLTSEGIDIVELN
jgi:hypothetical protein